MKIGRFNEAAKKMVDELYMVEAEGSYQEVVNTTISVKLLVSTASMLTTLSELFGQSRYAFTGEILEDFTTDLFRNLPEATRQEVAIKADKITTELYAKQDLTITHSDGEVGDKTWQGVNQAFSLLHANANEAMAVV
ncbi:MAG: hypothetical protein QX194_00890 [Methylococcales bacterium]